MADTAQVLQGLDLSKTQTKLLAIVANLRGAATALQHQGIDFIGYPFSISENFQMRNTHKTIRQSMDVLSDILDRSQAQGVAVVTYLSMGFGNPYGDPWSPEIVAEWTQTLVDMGTQVISLSDTIGAATPKVIGGIIFRFDSHVSRSGIWGSFAHCSRPMARKSRGGLWRWMSAI